MWTLWYVLIDVYDHCSGVDSGLSKLWCLLRIILSCRHHTWITLFLNLCLRIQLRYDMNISFGILLLWRNADSFSVINLWMPLSHHSVLRFEYWRTFSFRTGFGNNLLHFALSHRIIFCMCANFIWFETPCVTAAIVIQWSKTWI